MLQFTLWAQRRARLVPAPVRRAVARGLGTLAGRGDSLGPDPDWDRSLIRNRGGGGLESLRPVPMAAAEPAGAGTVGGPTNVTPRRHVGDPVRCVVAIDVLDAGGMDEFAAFLGRGLPRFGIETVVAYEQERMPGQTVGGRLVRELRAEGVGTVQISREDAAQWLAGHRPDVISVHGAPEWLLDAAGEQGVPCVETLHGMHSFLDRESCTAAQRRAARVSVHVAVSDLVRRQYLARVPTFPADRVVTIPNGVAAERTAHVNRVAARAALGLREEFVFLSLARYHLQKNTFGLVSAFADVALEHPEAHLVFAGRSDDPLYFAQLHRHAAKLACADRIHLRGHCPNPPALLAAADAFVLDSFFEGWSLASMEALAAGLPVVMSDVGGAREQLGSGGDRGHLVANPAGDPALIEWRVINDLRFRPQDNRAELVSAMSSVVRHRDRWAAARQRLAEAARAEFSPEACLQRHADVLRDAARRCAPAAR